MRAGRAGIDIRRGSMATSHFDLRDRVALVTGASRGIGRSIAQLLAGQGATVVISSRRLPGCEEVVREIREAGGEAIALACHIGEPEQIVAAFAEIDARYGRIDILVNNAATNPYYGPAVDMELPALQKTLDVNLRGYFVASVEAGRRMIGCGKGSVVNIASVNAVRPMQGQVLYSMTKAAIVNMTQGLAREWGPAGVRVNAVVPGIVETRFAAALHEDARLRATFESLLPLGRIGQPDEIAGAVLYLVSDAAGYTTGSCITVDGGWLA